MYQCTNPECSLRFPAIRPLYANPLCPRCKALTQRVPQAQEIKSFTPPVLADPGQKVEVFLDNIRSTFNVGAMFRTADGAGISQITLCGITPLPDNPKVSKTALGAELSVPWTYYPNGLNAVKAIQQSGKHLLALEVTPDASSLFEYSPPTDGQPLVLVVGNEVTGIDPEIGRLCEQTIWIPMSGYKRSLNVSIAFGIAVYYLRYQGVIRGNRPALSGEGSPSLESSIDLPNQKR